MPEILLYLRYHTETSEKLLGPTCVSWFGTIFTSDECVSAFTTLLAMDKLLNI